MSMDVQTIKKDRLRFTKDKFPANLLLLELCWAVPGLMISEWTRNI